MLSLLPLLFLAAAVVVFRCRGVDALRATLVGAVVTALWAAVGAECLSLCHAFERSWVIAWWGVPALCLGTYASVLCRRGGAALRIAVPAGGGGASLAMAVACVAILSVTGVLALLTPPTTHDCLSYHLPRQLFWIQQRSVEHFPTLDLRQLEMPPLAEFIGAQLMILSGNDHQANMVQWVSYALSAAACAAIVRELGAGSRGQWLAALLVLCHPMAAIQSINPKNDVVCEFFALMVLYGSTRLILRRGRNWPDAVLLGVSMGLLILTKGTGFLIIAPFACVVGVWMLWTLRVRALLPGISMAVIAIAINCGHWWRNYQSFESPLALPASKEGFRLANEVFSAPAIASNVLRNLVLHVGTPWESVNGVADRVLGRVHEVLGITTTDPRTTYLPDIGFWVASRWNAEGGAADPFCIVLSGMLVVALALRRFRLKPGALALFACVGVAALLFCIALKWQLWHARLHLPFLALTTPFIALWIESWRWVAIRRVVVALVAGYALAAVVCNQTKPLVGEDSVLTKSRDEMRYFWVPTRRESINSAAEKIAELKPARVGIAFPPHSLEYLAMRAILDRVEPRPQLMYIECHARAPAPVDEPSPDVVCLMTSETPTPKVHSPSGTRFDTLTAHGMFYVQVPTLNLSRALRVKDRPPFFGWDEEVGLDRMEGPYPQWDLPLVRWASVNRTVLTYTSQGEDRVLLIECRRNDRTDQALKISHNGRVVAEHEFGKDWVWVPIRVSLPSIEGRNEVCLEYRNINEPKIPRAVLFKRLQIVPAAWVEPLEQPQ